MTIYCSKKSCVTWGFFPFSPVARKKLLHCECYDTFGCISPDMLHILQIKKNCPSEVKIKGACESERSATS